MTISIARVDAFSLGMLIAAFERAVGFYATLVGINAYHQPGVEAGKKAAADFLAKLAAVKAGLSAVPQTAEAIGAGAGLEAEDVHHALNHLAANLPGVQRTAGASPAEDCYWRE
jgi:glucose-6-phosphate isomerase